MERAVETNLLCILAQLVMNVLVPCGFVRIRVAGILSEMLIGRQNLSMAYMDVLAEEWASRSKYVTPSARAAMTCKSW